MHTLTLAFTSAASGSLGLTAWAAESLSNPAPGIAAYVGGGAGVIAVGALAEVTRRLLNGRLIPRETKDVEEEIGAAIVAAGQREALVLEKAESMRKAMEDVRDEMRNLRRAVEGSQR